MVQTAIRAHECDWKTFVESKVFSWNLDLARRSAFPNKYLRHHNFQDGKRIAQNTVWLQYTDDFISLNPFRLNIAELRCFPFHNFPCYVTSTNSNRLLHFREQSKLKEYCPILSISCKFPRHLVPTKPGIRCWNRGVGWRPGVGNQTFR